MQGLYDTLYHAGLPLKATGIVIGLFLIISHGLALAFSKPVKEQLKLFPRNTDLGTGLIVVGFAWAFFIWTYMDLGEWFKLEKGVQLIMILVCAGMIAWVKEFISVRALGFLMILAAAPILEAAFLKEPQSRLLIVALAYAMALAGMFWVGMPYLLRDLINWVLAKNSRYTIGAAAGIAYGAAVLIAAIASW